MNAAQLAMITAYAQAQQIAGYWEFSEDEDRAWYEFGGGSEIFYLFLNDEGFSLRKDTGGTGHWVEGLEVAITSLRQLKALMA
jgi:hypothetical protein